MAFWKQVRLALQVRISVSYKGANNDKKTNNSKDGAGFSDRRWGPFGGASSAAPVALRAPRWEVQRVSKKSARSS
eukprot:7635998-Pyramimonas_sp.AAC.1